MIATFMAATPCVAISPEEGYERNRKGISNQDIEGAWSKEIEPRLAEIDAGSVELIPWEEVRAELFRCQ